VRHFALDVFGVVRHNHSMLRPCIMSSRGGEVEYHVEVWARGRFTRTDFEIFRDSIALYLRVLEEGAEPDDIWEGEPH